MTTIKTAEQVVTDALYAEEPEIHQGSAVQFMKASRRARVSLAALRGAGLLAEAGSEASERVAARLREVVYLCGDGLGCQCEEAQDGSADLARELSIVAAGRPILTTAEVWGLAQALHDEAGDTGNVAAFASSLVDSLRVAGIWFDEVEFVERGMLGSLEPAPAPDAPAAPAIAVDDGKIAEVVKSVIDRRPYREATRFDIRGLEVAVARAVVEALGGDR